MKVGDLVKRADHWIEWLKYNKWMKTLEEEQEMGMIIKIDPKINEGAHDVVAVLWSHGGLSWENLDDLEVINESR